MDLIEKAYLDIHNGDPSELLLVMEDGEYPEDLLYYFGGHDTFHPMEKALLLHASGKILDAGAGPGRIALYLESCGFRVSCADSSPVMRDIGMARGCLSYSLMDLLGRVEPSEAFDTVTLMGNTTGICRDDDDLKTLMDNLAAFVKPGGRILLTFTDPEVFGAGADTLLKYRVKYRGEEEDGTCFLVSPGTLADALNTSCSVEYADLRDGLYGMVIRKR